MRIGIVMLGVQDMAASVAFYRDRLGLAVKGQMESFAFLDAGPLTLCLSGALAKASSQIVGATEVVFSVESVRSAYKALKDKGVTFVNEPRAVAGPNWAANFTDPDGHKLSIFGPE
jgi:catechol 2,3-dioxygenase-like lactoylglutathione lyase family enzyme